MATDLDTRTELEEFQHFIISLIDRGKQEVSPEESLAAFRAYQQDLQRLREEIEPALEQSAGGASVPLDIDQLKTEVTETLEEKGISE